MSNASDLGLTELRPSTRLQLIDLPRAVGERWALTDPYVELVWVEPLGVTAVAVARRLAVLAESIPKAHATSLSALATPLRVPPAKVLRSLRRLHHHGLVVWREHVGVIGLSGFARGLDAAAVAGLSSYGARLHRSLSAETPPPTSSPAMSPAIGSSVAVEVER